MDVVDFTSPCFVQEGAKEVVQLLSIDHRHSEALFLAAGSCLEVCEIDKEEWIVQPDL